VTAACFRQTGNGRVLIEAQPRPANHQDRAHPPRSALTPAAQRRRQRTRHSATAQAACPVSTELIHSCNSVLEARRFGRDEQRVMVPAVPALARILVGQGDCHGLCPGLAPDVACVPDVGEDLVVNTAPNSVSRIRTSGSCRYENRLSVLVDHPHRDKVLQPAAAGSCRPGGSRYR
jgi:hypothetical protein